MVCGFRVGTNRQFRQSGGSETENRKLLVEYEQGVGRFFKASPGTKTGTMKNAQNTALRNLDQVGLFHIVLVDY